jgi:hypothetical protein
VLTPLLGKLWLTSLQSCKISTDFWILPSFFPSSTNFYRYSKTENFMLDGEKCRNRPNCALCLFPALVSFLKTEFRLLDVCLMLFMQRMDFHSYGSLLSSRFLQKPICWVLHYILLLNRHCNDLRVLLSLTLGIRRCLATSIIVVRPDMSVVIFFLVWAVASGPSRTRLCRTES